MSLKARQAKVHSSSGNLRDSDFLLPVLYNAPGHFPLVRKKGRVGGDPHCALVGGRCGSRSCCEGNVCSELRPKEGGVVMVTKCSVCSLGNRAARSRWEVWGGLA